MHNISRDASPSLSNGILWKRMVFAPDKSPASNTTPDQARPNYTVVTALLPLETLQRSDPAVSACALQCVFVRKRFSVLYVHVNVNNFS